jgi:hypothetical protein
VKTLLVILVVLASIGCYSDPRTLSNEEAIAAPGMGPIDDGIGVEVCSCEAMQREIMALEEELATPPEMYWRTSSTDGCETTARAMCDAGDIVESGECLDSESNRYPGGPIEREDNTFGWSCKLSSDGCARAVALCRGH